MTEEYNDIEETKENKAMEEVTSFIRRNFPQIQMHGGSFDILDIDVKEGHVHIVLSGACSGCGISPMTVQAMQTRMYQDIDFVNSIDVDTGLDSLGSSTQQPVKFTKDNKETQNSDVNAPF